MTKINHCCSSLGFHISVKKINDPKMYLVVYAQKKLGNMSANLC